VHVDEALRKDPEIVFNAGAHTEAVGMTYADYERGIRPEKRKSHRPHLRARISAIRPRLTRMFGSAAVELASARGTQRSRAAAASGVASSGRPVASRYLKSACSWEGSPRPAGTGTITT
jgi:hypothetical protein